MLTARLLMLLPSLSSPQLTSLLNSRAHGFPLDLPTPVAPPSLSIAVPNGCSPACSLFDLLLFNPDFSTFLAALKLSGLIGLLTEDGPFTVFAPTNAAFDSLLPSELQTILADPNLLRATMLRHLSNGRLVSGTFPAGSFPVVTGGGEEIILTTSPATIGHLGVASLGKVGSVIEVDNEAVNGVIHVVNVVL